jgi:hypothetical protein
VTVDDPGAVKVVASHADVKVGPGPVNFRPSGEGVVVTGTAGVGSRNACVDKFVEFPK